MTAQPTGRRTGLTLDFIVWMLWARQHTGLFIDSPGFNDLQADRKDLTENVAITSGSCTN